MKKKLVITRNFVRRHRTLITVIATATPLLMMEVNRAKVWNEFLDSHDLLDEFYHSDEI